MEQWSALLGPAQVLTEAAALAAAQTATYPTHQRVLAIVRPGTRDEVRACVRVANLHGVALYPISTGKNWGFGSRVPCFDGTVILDLGRLDRIVELDEELAYVVVEPGVTQQQLHEYLQRETGGRLWLDATSSSAACSLIGNLLERGHGVTTYCDHAAQAADYEVILPTGECIHTGYGAFADSATRALDAWGLGPCLTGLFSQSSFGIITRATIWLMRAPEHAEVAFFTVDRPDAFERLVDELRPLRLDRLLRCGPFFGNIYQALQKVTKYPWELTGGAVPLATEIALQLGKQHRFGLWNGSLALYGTHDEVAAQKQRLMQVLRNNAQWHAFVDKQPSNLDQTFPASRHSEVRSVVAGFTGAIGSTGLPAGYWRMRTPPGGPRWVDLDRDGCGFKFWTATTPFRGRDAARAAAIATETILRHNFEPSIGILPVRERALQFHIACAYDRQVSGEDEAVMACHEELSERLMDCGYYPTRLGPGSMHALQRWEPAYNRLLQTLKHAIDPNDIIAPGRYQAGPP